MIIFYEMSYAIQDTTKWKYQKIISSGLSANSDHVNFITIHD